MPRTTPSDRLVKLLDAAAAAFVEHGFQRTQMDDIAERLGVSKGTVYRAVDSKDTLFAAVIAWGDTPDDLPADGLAPTNDLAGSRDGDRRPSWPMPSPDWNSPRSSPTANASVPRAGSVTRSNASPPASTR